MIVADSRDTRWAFDGRSHRRAHCSARSGAGLIAISPAPMRPRTASRGEDALSDRLSCRRLPGDGRSLELDVDARKCAAW